jgi:prevent-host-death family protein
LDDVVKTIGSYEAKTHLPRLLDEVAAGEVITITKHGVPVATLSPVRSGAQAARAAADDLLQFRANHRLDGLTIRELIEDGRRR